MAIRQRRFFYKEQHNDRNQISGESFQIVGFGTEY